MTTATISFLSVVVTTPSQRGCNGCQTVLSSTKSSSPFRRISLCSSTSSSSNPAIVQQEISSSPPESTSPLDPDALPPTGDREECSGHGGVKPLSKQCTWPHMETFGWHMENNKPLLSPTLQMEEWSQLISNSSPLSTSSNQTTKISL